MKRFLAMAMTLWLVFCLMSIPAQADASDLNFDTDAYLVLVVDEGGAPVSGVTVQFCSDTECMFGRTDKTGLARFDAEPGTYTIHLLKVPDGFRADQAEYAAPDTRALTTITLTSDVPAAEADETVWTNKDIGFTFELPEGWRGLKGTPDLTSWYPVDGVLEIGVNYFAVEPARFDEYLDFGEEYLEALMSGADLPVPPEPTWVNRNFDYVFQAYAIDGGRSEEELLQALLDAGVERAKDSLVLEPFGSDGEVNFFIGQYSYSEDDKAYFEEEMGKEFFDEFMRLHEDPDAVKAGLKLSAPKWPARLQAGDVLRFEAAGMDGSTISSAEIFSGAKVTILNLWATWCTPCKHELPELGQMAAEVEARGASLVGLVADGAEEGKMELAASILKEAGAEYLNVAAPENVDELIPVEGYPTTFFVDSEGMLLTDPITGAYPDRYLDALDEALAKAG